MIAINEHTLLEQYKDLIPKGPYVAIIGTSHTAGDCDDGYVEKTYGEIFADKLGLGYLNLGSSGAFNEDLLEITLTALHSGLLKDCKLAIIEGRLGTTIRQISKVPVLQADDTYLRDVNTYNSSIIINARQFDSVNMNYQGASSSLHMVNVHADMSLDDLSKSFKLDPKHDTGVNLYVLHKVNEYIKTKIYHESHTPMNIYNDMLLLNAMVSVLKGNGIETYWFNMGGSPVRTSFINTLYSTNLLFKDTTDFDYNCSVSIDNSLSMQTELIRRHGKTNFEDNLCSCSHGNQTIHYWIADMLLEKLNAARNN